MVGDLPWDLDGSIHVMWFSVNVPVQSERTQVRSNITAGSCVCDIRLHTLTAVPRSAQLSTLFGKVK